MIRLVAITAMTALLLPTQSVAYDEWEDPYDRYEQQRILQAEMDQARERGGYNNLFTALTNLFAGTATEQDIAPAINNLQDVPGYEGVSVNRRGKF
ncbi:MAG: hypothetical protein AAGJ28_12095 [Pseudomonadota bacterium]